MSSPSAPRDAPAPDGRGGSAPSSGPGLSAVQVAASALASVTAAVVSSFFGVAGTVVGAAVASTISVVASATYTASLRRTNARLKHLATAAGTTTLLTPRVRRRTGWPETPGKPAAGGASAEPPTADPTGRGGAVPEAEQPAGAEQDPVPGGDGLLDRLRRLPRGPVALATVGVFVLVLATVTVIELVVREPLSTAVRGTGSTGTSVSQLFAGGGATRSPTPTPTASASPTPGPSVTAAATPSAGPTSASPGPSATPTAPAASPSPTGAASAPPTPATATPLP
ncbi:MAG TPA: hypothetical protein VGD03_06430 [Frankiaceae bacterium]